LCPRLIAIGLTQMGPFCFSQIAALTYPCLEAFHGNNTHNLHVSLCVFYWFNILNSILIGPQIKSKNPSKPPLNQQIPRHPPRPSRLFVKHLNLHTRLRFSCHSSTAFSFTTSFHLPYMEVQLPFPTP